VRFGNYEILYELKSGGMGAVLLGRRRGPGTFEQLVAIKTIRPEYAKTEAVRAMFLDEAAILARLNHPGIATVHDFGEDGGTLYMVMEYVAGIALREVPTMPSIVVARAIGEAARGLHAAHEARDSQGQPLGLVHRDISPDNLMLGYDGHVKVIDFGIALVKNRQAPVTEFGTLKGKPPYMSPEQVKNDPMDRRSDVFSLGVVTWELLTGKSLFDGDSIYAIAYAVENQELVPPSRVIGSSLPSGLDAAVMNALARDPDQRTPTAAAFAEALDGIVQASGGESLAAWADRELEAKRSEHRVWLAGVTGGAGTQLPRAKGRASGLQTEIGAAPVSEPIVVKPPGDPVDPVAETSLGLDASPPAKRKLAPFTIVLAAILLVAVAVWMATHRAEHVAKITPASIDASVPKIAVAPPDAAAAPVVPIVVDAAVAVITHDAPPIRHRHHDAGVVAVATPPVDAPTPAPVGEGLVTIRTKADGPYSNIVIDRGVPLAPPINKKKLAAGRHTIQFMDPEKGTVLDTQTIELVDGQAVTVTQR